MYDILSAVILFPDISSADNWSTDIEDKMIVNEMAVDKMFEERWMFVDKIMEYKMIVEKMAIDWMNIDKMTEDTGVLKHLATTVQFS